MSSTGTATSSLFPSRVTARGPFGTGRPPKAVREAPISSDGPWSIEVHDDELSIAGLDVGNLVAVAEPACGIGTALGDLPLRSGSRKRRDEKLLPARLVGQKGQPPAIRRELARNLPRRRCNERVGLAPVDRHDPDVHAPCLDVLDADCNEPSVRGPIRRCRIRKPRGDDLAFGGTVRRLDQNGSVGPTVGDLATVTRPRGRVGCFVSWSEGAEHAANEVETPEAAQRTRRRGHDVGRCSAVVGGNLDSTNRGGIAHRSEILSIEVEPGQLILRVGARSADKRATRCSKR